MSMILLQPASKNLHMSVKLKRCTISVVWFSSLRAAVSQNAVFSDFELFVGTVARQSFNRRL